MEQWQSRVEGLRFSESKSWAEIAQVMASEFPGLTVSQVREKCRDYIRGLERYKKSGPKLVFSDIHAPFDHPNFPYFLQSVYKTRGCSSAVCSGDLIDSHAISNHPVEPCALGAYTEFDLAAQRLKIYTTLIPEADVIVGNHDLRYVRVAAEKGLGRRFLKSLSEILELPAGWVIRGDEFIEDDVLYCHGINCGGKDGALNKALLERMSTCIGHYHSFGGVKYAANKRDRVFGINVGCGINEDAYAFAYGKHAKNRCTLGCGVVYDSEHAEFIPMGREWL